MTTALPTIELPVAQCCAPLATPDLDEAEAGATAGLFKALADPHRVRIVNLLVNSDGPICVCDFTEPLGLSQPTVSFHLKKLRDAGLIFLRRVHGAPDPRKLKALTAFVTELGIKTESLESRFALQKLLKDIEGDPLILGERRRLRQRQGSLIGRLGLPASSVVVTGSDHLAGLRYHRTSAPLPIIVFKTRGDRVHGVGQDVRVHLVSIDQARDRDCAPHVRHQQRHASAHVGAHRTVTIVVRDRRVHRRHRRLLEHRNRRVGIALFVAVVVRRLFAVCRQRKG